MGAASAPNDSDNSEIASRCIVASERREDPAKIDHAEIVEIDGAKRFRYMKAIPTGGVCVACHGASLNPKVAAKLDSLYPGDKARGFKPGDIRGAFTVAWQEQGD